jgi:hypothetical protein
MKSVNQKSNSQMKTSASTVPVMFLLTVLTRWEVSTVPASLDMMEMDSLVMTSMSVRNQLWLLSVLRMPSVATFLDTLSASVNRDIQEMQLTHAQVRVKDETSSSIMHLFSLPFLLIR